MPSKASLLSLCLAVAALACVALACGGGSAGPLADAEQGGVYLALGDSFAAGEGASDATTTSYAALIHAALRQRFGDEVHLQSLANGGHTTQDLIDEQLPAALDALRAGDVRLVTLTIGGNDLYQYSADADCLVDPASPDCPLRDGLTGVRERLSRILTELQTAGPDATIVIEAYPDVFSGSGHVFEGPAKTAFGLLNEVIVAVAEERDVLLADPREAFLGRSLELTHISDTPQNFHPNDAGHRFIADAFLRALGLAVAR